jgi:hypothetical protein
VPAGEGSARLSLRVDDDVLVLRVFGERPPRRRVVLELHDDGVSASGGSMIHRGTVMRRIDDGPAELIATNAKRLLDDAERGRTCLTCDRLGCGARVEVPAGEVESAGS